MTAPQALKLVSEELLQKHHVLPLFKRGNKLFVGTSNPTQTAALAELQFHTNLVVEPVLVDEDQIRRTLEQWQNAGGQISGDVESLGEPHAVSSERGATIKSLSSAA